MRGASAWEQILLMLPLETTGQPRNSPNTRVQTAAWKFRRQVKHSVAWRVLMVGAM